MLPLNEYISTLLNIKLKGDGGRKNIRYKL